MADLEWMLHVSVLYMQYQHMKSLNLDRAAATLRSDAEATLKVNISPEHLKYLPLEPGILSNLAREERPLLKLVSLGLQQLSQGQALPSNGNGEDDHDTWQLSVTVLFMQCEHLHALGLPSTGSILKMDVEQTLNVQLSPRLLEGLPLVPEVRSNLQREPHPLLTLVALGMRQLSIPSASQAPVPQPKDQPPQPPERKQDTPRQEPLPMPNTTNSSSSTVKSPRAGLILKKDKPFETWTWKERVATFYSEKAPERVRDVDKVLKQYAGHEEQLMANLIVKYGESTYEKPHHVDPEVMRRLHAEKEAHEERQLAAIAANQPQPSSIPAPTTPAPAPKEQTGKQINPPPPQPPPTVPPPVPAHPHSAHVDSILENLDSMSLDAMLSTKKSKAEKKERKKKKRDGTKNSEASSSVTTTSATNASPGRQRRRRGGSLHSGGKRASLMGFLDADQVAMIQAAAAEAGHGKKSKYQDEAHHESVKHLMFVHEPRSSLVHRKFVRINLPLPKTFPVAKEDGGDDGKITQVQKVPSAVQGGEPETITVRADVHQEVAKPSREVLLRMTDRVNFQDNGVIGVQPLMLRDVNDYGVPSRVRPSMEFLDEELVLAINPAAMLRAIISSTKYRRMGEEAFEESSDEEEPQEWVKFKFKTKGEIERARLEAQNEQRRKKNTDDVPWRTFVETHQESCSELFQLFHCMPTKFCPDMEEFFMRLTLFLDTHDDEVPDVIEMLHNWFDMIHDRFSWYNKADLKVILGEARKLISHLGTRLLLRKQIDEVIARIDELEAKAKISSSGGHTMKGAVHSVIALNRMKGLGAGNALGANPAAKPRKLKASNIWNVSVTKGDWEKVDGEDEGGEKAPEVQSAVFGADSNAARANQGLPPQPRVEKDLDLLTDEHNNLFKFDPREVARQMTLTAHDLFKQIPVHELDTGAWAPDDRRKHLADGVFQYLDYFEAINNLVRLSVLQVRTPQERANRISYFVAMMNECFELRNANGASQIISALVLRKYPKELLETMSKVPEEDIQMMEEKKNLFTIQQSYKMYRQKLDDWISGVGVGETKYAGHGDGIIPDLQVHLQVSSAEV